MDMYDIPAADLAGGALASIALCILGLVIYHQTQVSGLAQFEEVRKIGRIVILFIMTWALGRLSRIALTFFGIPYVGMIFSAMDIVVAIYAAHTMWKQSGGFLREVVLKGQAETKVLKALTDTATDGYWEWDIDSGREFMSPKWFETLGYTAEEGRVLLKGPSSELIHPADRERSTEAVSAHLNNGRPYSEILRFRRKDGTYAWILDRGVAIADSDGVFRHMVGTHTDISELKTAEQQLLRSNRDLEQFAYAASHDLQEPLRMINGWTAALFADFGHLFQDPEAMIMKVFITDGVQRMRVLIQDLLRFSKAGQGLKLVPASPVLAASAAMKNLQAVMLDTEASLVYGDLPMVLADTSMLSHVFQNVFSNSLKFRTPGKPPTLIIGGVVQSGMVKISIADNGIGIDPKYLPKVFEVFTRLYSREEYEGTGIGLALARRIIHAHGGDIGISSNGPGTGTTVWFTLKHAGVAHA